MVDKTIQEHDIQELPKLQALLYHRAEVILWAKRLHENANLSTKSGVRGHSKTTSEIHDPLLKMRSDTMFYQKPAPLKPLPFITILIASKLTEE